MGKPIATISEIKVYAGITSANQDALLTSLMPGCLKAIGAFCNREFSSRTVTEYRDGNGSARMLLVNYPITQVTSLTIDGRSIPASVNGSAGYVANPGSRQIVLVGYRFTQGLRNVVITLEAGYGDDNDVNPWPEELKLAFMMYVVTRSKERERLGIGSKSLAGESITVTDATSGTSSGSQGIPSAAKGMLKQYQNSIPESGE